MRRADESGIPDLAQEGYTDPARRPGMKGITIKLPERTLQQLKREAASTGRTVGALVRERVEAPDDQAARSVYDLTADLAGAVAGGRRPATNQRKRFRRA
jgi:hypothetical protein